MKQVLYQTTQGRNAGYYLFLTVLLCVTGVALYAAHYMDINGHHVTGMNNQIVWGMPHVFAIFLIVAASGALNVGSIASVFGNIDYNPLARLSALLAIALLAGGLAVLVLDLGQPDRLIVAMTYYNFKSIFAWNIFLYTGFILIVAVYLWMMFERRFNRYSKPIGMFAFVWRFILTTGTGSIFGFLVARQAYDAAIMAPLFIVMSLSFGTASFILVLIATYKWTQRPLSDDIVNKLRKLNGIFVAAVLYIVLAYHLTNLYATEHHGVERFILLEGGAITFVFWVVQILIGGVIPLILLFAPRANTRVSAVLASCLIIIGAFGHLYVIIIGGQAFPLQLFPGMEVTSSFYDGVAGNYSPSMPEFGLGFGGIAMALLIVVIAVRVLPFLPASLVNLKSTESNVAGDTQAARV
ncbi:MAG: polysulfide reductase NrfD [Gammaproteobacteria bacterium]|nr:polysulfide reductase NrfD [Gammaproteobacteria bacterium]